MTMPIINKNGVYQAWSKLFDYRTKESFELSKKLPFPDSNPETNNHEFTVEETNDSINITQELIDELNGIDDVDNQRLNLSAKVLNKLDKSNIPNARLFYNPSEIYSNIDWVVTDEDRNILNTKLTEFLTNLDKDIKRHNSGLSPKEILSASKNFVYNKIYQISDSFKNLVAAESPISMGDPQAAAAKSKAGGYAKTVTDFCPSVKWTLFFENMAGKEVIGISAVGQKIFLASTQYFNQEIRKLAEKGITAEDLMKSNIYFNNLFNIYKTVKDDKGKTSEELATLFTNSLANINLTDIEFVYDLLKQAGDKVLTVKDAINLTQNRYQDDKSLVISALISAATDNAKELILSKINAGPDLAGVYIYFIIQGLSFDSISDLMTSDVLNSIVQGSTVNRMYGEKESIDSLIKKIEYGVSLNNYVNSSYLPSIKYYLSRLVSKGILPKIDKPTLQNYASNPKYLETLIKDLNETKDVFTILPSEDEMSLYGDILYEGMDESFSQKQSDNVIKGLLRYLRKQKKINNIKNVIDSSEANTSNFNTFKTAYREAKEITVLGRILGINGGIKTKSYDRYNFEKSFNTVLQDGVERIYQSQKDTTPSNNSVEDLINGIISYKSNSSIYTPEEVRTIVHDALYVLSNDGSLESIDFNLGKFLNDPEYKNRIIKFYNLFKSVVNVFDLIDKLPHYKAFIQAYYINEQNTRFGTVKYALLRDISSKLENSIMKRRVGNINMKNKLSEDQYNIVRDYTDELIIKKYLASRNISLSIPKGQNYFIDRKVTSATDKTAFLLSNDDGLASFKLYMDSYVIPTLKSGYTVNSREVPVFGSELMKNDFLNNLVISDRASKLDGSPYTYYRSSLNMTNSEDNPEFDKQVASFGAIENVEFRGVKLSDLFFIYNLITHKGRKGQDSILKVLQGATFNQGSLIVDYHRYIGDLDYNTSEPEVYDSQRDKLTLDDVNFDDILIRLAPIKGTLEELISGNKYTKTYDQKLGRYKIQEKIKDPKGKSVRYADVEIQGDSKYYLLQSDINYKLKVDSDKTSQSLKLTDLVTSLMRANKIKIILDC